MNPPFNTGQYRSQVPAIAATARHNPSLVRAFQSTRHLPGAVAITVFWNSRPIIQSEGFQANRETVPRYVADLTDRLGIYRSLRILLTAVRFSFSRPLALTSTSSFTDQAELSETPRARTRQCATVSLACAVCR